MADVQLGLIGGARAVRGWVEYPLEQADPLRLWPRWLADEPRAMASLRGALPWEQHRLWTPGGVVAAPRLECWLADRAGTPYVYSGERYTSHRLADVPGLAEIRDRVVRTTGIEFDAVFANLYRSGDDSIGWHADDEEDALGPAGDVVIASLSLGARRPFQVKSRDGAERIEIDLGCGDLLLMGRGVQSRYLHQVPKRRRAGARLNLTFRRLRGER